MKSRAPLFVLILSILANGFAYLLITYLASDARYFRLLATQPTAAEIERELGKSREILPGNVLPEYRGWALPRQIPADTAEIWLYDIRTGRRFFIFVPADRQAPISGFFSSTS